MPARARNELFKQQSGSSGAGRISSLTFWMRYRGYTRRPWLAKLLERRSTKIAAVALANKIARIAWAMMMHGTYYQEPKAQTA